MLANGADPATAIPVTTENGGCTSCRQDVPAIAAVAHRHGAVVVMDNSWATPLGFRAFDHGVDVSVHAATKYIGGHSDVLAGVVAGRALVLVIAIMSFLSCLTLGAVALIREAIAATISIWPAPPELGIVTFVDAGKVNHKRDPGRCYVKAGFRRVGFTKGGLVALRLAPDGFPSADAPVGHQGFLEVSA